MTRRLERHDAVGPRDCQEVGGALPQTRSVHAPCARLQTDEGEATLCRYPSGTKQWTQLNNHGEKRYTELDDVGRARYDPGWGASR